MAARSGLRSTKRRSNPTRITAPSVNPEGAFSIPEWGIAIKHALNMETQALIPILMDIKGQLGTVEAKLDAYKSDHDKSVTKIAELDGRVGVIEKGRARESGVIAAIAAALSLGATSIIDWITA